MDIILQVYVQKKNKSTDVEFKLIKPGIIQMRIWKSPRFVYVYSKCRLILKSQLKLKEFISMIIEGYSGFLTKYGFSRIASRYGENVFPLISFLKLLRFLKSEKKNISSELKVLETDMEFMQELEFLVSVHLANQNQNIISTRNRYENLFDDLSVKLPFIIDGLGDISDLGNKIGILVGNWIKKRKPGFEKNDFLSGIYHGLSLTDGTH